MSSRGEAAVRMVVSVVCIGLVIASFGVEKYGAALFFPDSREWPARGAAAR